MKTAVFYTLLLLFCLNANAQGPQKQMFTRMSQLGKSFTKISMAKTNDAIALGIDSARAQLNDIETIYEEQSFVGLDFTFYRLNELIAVLDSISRTDFTNLSVEEKTELNLVFRKLDSAGRFLIAFDTLKLKNKPIVSELVTRPLSESDKLASSEVNVNVQSTQVINISCCDLDGDMNPFDDDGGILGGLISAGRKLFKKLRKMTPKELETWSVKLLGQGLKTSGQAMQIFDEEFVRPVTSISGETIALLQTLTERKDKFISKVANELSKKTGSNLPKELEKQYKKFFNANESAFHDGLRITHKTMGVASGLLTVLGTNMELFGKYLLLANNGFPGELSVKAQDLDNSMAIAKLDKDLLNELLQQIIKYKYTNESQALSLLAGCESAKLVFDDARNTFMLEVTDIKARASHPYSERVFNSFSFNGAVSGSFTVKKLKIQLIPEIIPGPVPTLKFSGRIIYLDVKNLLPKLDQTLAWWLQKEEVEKLSFTFELNTLVESTVKLRGAQPDSIT
ncbi:MAG: hypothetical protein WCF67_01230, partial [Chitinophagaceae bacterium]